MCVETMRDPMTKYSCSIIKRKLKTAEEKAGGHGTRKTEMG